MMMVSYLCVNNVIINVNHVQVQLLIVHHVLRILLECMIVVKVPVIVRNIIMIRCQCSNKIRCVLDVHIIVQPVVIQHHVILVMPPNIDNLIKEM